MTTKQELIYSSHVENLRHVQLSIEEIFLLAKNKIKTKNENSNNFKSIVRLLILQLGIWSEVRYNKLISEYNYLSPTKDKFFTELELKFLNLKKNKIDQWINIVELSFRKHYDIYIGHELKESNLGSQKYTEYTSILNIIDKYLRSIIEVRNKLAHGHWIQQLNDNGQQNNNINIASINSENLITLEKKYQIIQYLAKIIHDLMISKPTFERDFTLYYKEVMDRKKFIDKHSDNAYLKLKNKLQR